MEYNAATEKVQIKERVPWLQQGSLEDWEFIVNVSPLSVHLSVPCQSDNSREKVILESGETFFQAFVSSA